MKKIIKNWLLVILVLFGIWCYIYIDNYTPIDNDFFENNAATYRDMAEYVLSNYFTEERNYPCLYKYHQVRDVCFPVDGLLKYDEAWKLEKIDASYLSALFDKLRINAININQWSVSFSLRYKIITSSWYEESFIDYITKDWLQKLNSSQYIKTVLDEDLWLYVIGYKD